MELTREQIRRQLAMLHKSQVRKFYSVLMELYKGIVVFLVKNYFKFLILYGAAKHGWQLPTWEEKINFMKTFGIHKVRFSYTFLFMV